jgi:hypothetical protein
MAYVTVTACNKNYLGFSLKQRKETVKDSTGIQERGG